MFLKPVTEIKKSFMMLGKVAPGGKKMVYAKCTVLWWRLCKSSFRTITYIVNKQSGIYRKYLEVSKLQHMFVIGWKWIFFFKFERKLLKQSSPNLGGLSRRSFLSPYSNETTSLKTIPSFGFAYIFCML